MSWPRDWLEDREYMTDFLLGLALGSFGTGVLITIALAVLT